MGVKGDFKKLRQLITNLDKIGAGHLLERRVSNALAVETMKLIQDGFRKEQDPYGNPWAPLKSRKGGRILRDTGRMAASANAQAKEGGGVKGQISTSYAKYHQGGAHHDARSDARERVVVRGIKSGRFQRNRTTGPLGTVHRYRASYKSWDLTPRMMVPDARRGLGPIWSAAYRRVAQRAIKGLIRDFGGGGG